MRIDQKSDPICSSAGCDQYKHPHPDGFKKDYFVPNFGQDTEVKNSLSSAAQAETSAGHFWDVLAPEPDDPKRNYFVPHFGTDSDINASLSSLNSAESKFGPMSTPEFHGGASI